MNYSKKINNDIDDKEELCDKELGDKLYESLDDARGGATKSVEIGLLKDKLNELVLASSTNVKYEPDERWLLRWADRYGVKLNRSGKKSDIPNYGGEEQDTDFETDEQNCRAAYREAIRGYSDDQVYLACCFRFDWRSLPDHHRNLASSSAAQEVLLPPPPPDEEEDKDDGQVLLLMASNRSGRHRTRLCVIGKNPKPDCLLGVNMFSQPVVYFGGVLYGDRRDDGLLGVSDNFFVWWFHHEFAPGALAINEKAILITWSDGCLAPDIDRLHAQNKRASAFDGTGIRDVELLADVVRSELRVRYVSLVLFSAYLEEDGGGDGPSIRRFMAKYSLKEAFPLLHRAWLTLRTDTFSSTSTATTTIRSSSTAIADTSVPMISLTLDGQSTEHERMLLQLQWLAHDLGLEVSDEDLVSWARVGKLSSDGALDASVSVTDNDNDEPSMEQTNNANCSSAGGSGEQNDSSYSARHQQQLTEVAPSASEAVTYLSKALLWMETESLDPNLLLFVRNIILLAKQARVYSFFF